MYSDRFSWRSIFCLKPQYAESCKTPTRLKGLRPGRKPLDRQTAPQHADAGVPLKRKEDSGEAGWKDLPPHVMDCILCHLAPLEHHPILREESYFRQPRAQDLLRMLSVCRAWRATLFQYPGAVYFDECKRLAICKLWPKLSQLHVNRLTTQMDFSGLDSLTRLSSLTLRDHRVCRPKEQQQLDLTLLPASLKVLDVPTLWVDSSSLKDLKCLSMTKLKFGRACNTPAEVCQLLQQLTLLQDLDSGSCSLSGLHEARKLEDERDGYFRSKSLTRLCIANGNLLSECELPIGASQLRELRIARTKINTSWLSKIATTLADLTELSLRSCTMIPLDSQALQAAGTLRSLELTYCSHGFMLLAAHSLESLSYSPQHEQTPDMFHMLASLSALTRLSLASVNFRKADGVNVLHKLRLLELCLYDCQGLAGAFATPGSLPALQKLEVRERSWRVLCYCFNPEARRRDELEEQREKAEAPQLRSSVLSLPSLEKLSGTGTLVSLGVPDGWRNCTECRCGYPEGRQQPCHCYYQIFRKMA